MPIANEKEGNRFAAGLRIGWMGILPTQGDQQNQTNR
jgi:hypothetical protein